jgi:hypothetical protein
LESWAHEGVAWAGLDKDREVDVKEGKVDDEWHYNQTNSPCHKVPSKVVL